MNATDIVAWSYEGQLSRRRRPMNHALIIEGVQYFPYVIRFTLCDGRRRRWMRWAPYPQALADGLQRELSERFGPNDIRDNRITVRAA